MSKNPIYLDHNAATPLDPQVKEVLLKEFSKGPSNPSSSHFFGQAAKKKLIQARQIIAHFLKVKEKEIFFTSGGTESLNLLIQGALKTSSGHIIATNIDHPALFENIKMLEKKGYLVTYLSCGLYGAPTVKQVKEAIRPDTSLIALSAANGETGVKLDLEGIAYIAQKNHIPLMMDGVALLGKERFSIPEGVTGMGFSAHKIYGPSGVGFFFLKSGFQLKSLLFGGPQESQKRPGTENIAGILGLAKAISILDLQIEKDMTHVKKLKEHFEKELLSKLKGVKINGKGKRLVNTSNLFFPNIDGEALLIYLDQKNIAASHGSACGSGSLEVSRVLRNMGLSKEEASSSIRFSFGRTNTEEEIERALKILIKAVSFFTCMRLS